MDKEQRERFQEALGRKQEDAEEKALANQPHGGAGDGPGGEGPVSGSQEDKLIGTDRQQDTFSVRDKNTGKGKKTADKWNQ